MSQRQGREASSRGFVPLCYLLNGVMSLFIFINFLPRLRRTIRFVRLLFGDNQESTVPCSYKAYKKMQNPSVIVEAKLTGLPLLAFSRRGFPLLQRAAVQVQQTSPPGLRCWAGCWHVCCRLPVAESLQLRKA